jgi:hypothetical protein
MDDSISAEARAAHEQASELIDERRFVDAVPHAEEAHRLAPAWSVVHWNLSVAYKHAGRWADCLRACDRAIELDPGDVEGMHWNAGIAATALGDWPRARAAWRAIGVAVDDGLGPLEMTLGATPIRIDPAASAEVVWCERVDPCRARIVNVPMPESGHGYGDLVLHDGEPRGRRQLGGRSVAVFDALIRLERSSFGTWQIEVDADDEATLGALTQLLEDAGTHVEDWTASVRALCTACSLGEAHDHEHAPAPSGWQRQRTLGVAAESEAGLRPLRRLRRWWRREVRSVERVL